MDITKWNPLITGHEGDISWFCYKNRCEKWRYEIMFTTDVFEKLNELNMTEKELVCTWNVEVCKIIQNKTLFENNFYHFPL